MYRAEVWRKVKENWDRRISYIKMVRPLESLSHFQMTLIQQNVSHFVIWTPKSEQIQTWFKVKELANFTLLKSPSAVLLCPKLNRVSRNSSTHLCSFSPSLPTFSTPLSSNYPQINLSPPLDLLCLWISNRGAKKRPTGATWESLSYSCHGDEINKFRSHWN